MNIIGDAEKALSKIEYGWNTPSLITLAPIIAIFALNIHALFLKKVAQNEIDSFNKKPITGKDCYSLIKRHIAKIDNCASAYAAGGLLQLAVGLTLSTALPIFAYLGLIGLMQLVTAGMYSGSSIYITSDSEETKGYIV